MTSTASARPAAVVDPSSLLADGAMPPRWRPAGRTLRSMGLADTVPEDITGHNGFGFLGFLGVSEPRTLGGGSHAASVASGSQGVDARKLFSSGE
jgi:hypothetical protein